MEILTATSMVFYLSYMEGAKEAGLSKEERCEFYEGMMTYTATHQIPDFSNATVKGFFIICKENIDATLRKMNRHQVASANGKKGGAPKGNRNAVKARPKTAPKQPQEEPRKSPKQNPQEAQPSATENNQKTTQKTTYSNTITNTETLTPTETNTKTISSSLLKEKKEKPEEVNKGINTQLTLQERNDIFFESLRPYIQLYGMEAVQAFYDYWCEPSQEGDRMRFEMERTWNLTHRLEIWVHVRNEMKQSRKYC